MNFLKKVKNENGASLIEILGSLMIISIIVISLINLSGFTSLSFIKSNDRTDAVLVAEEELHKTIKLLSSGSTIPTEKYVDGFRVVINKTNLIGNPSYENIQDDSTVSLQGLGIDDSGTQHLVTITVFYGRN